MSVFGEGGGIGGAGGGENENTHTDVLCTGKDRVSFLFGSSNESPMPCA